MMVLSPYRGVGGAFAGVRKAAGSLAVTLSLFQYRPAPAQCGNNGHTIADSEVSHYSTLREHPLERSMMSRNGLLFLPCIFEEQWSEFRDRFEII